VLLWKIAGNDVKCVEFGSLLEGFIRDLLSTVLSFTVAFLNVTCQQGTGCELTVWCRQMHAALTAPDHFAFPELACY